jgi:hypothetical protein
MLRKLARVSFNVLTALSLVLCGGVCLLWADTGCGPADAAVFAGHTEHTLT